MIKSIHSKKNITVRTNVLMYRLNILATKNNFIVKSLARSYFFSLDVRFFLLVSDLQIKEINDDIISIDLLKYKHAGSNEQEILVWPQEVKQSRNGNTSPAPLALNLSFVSRLPLPLLPRSRWSAVNRLPVLWPDMPSQRGTAICFQ